MPRKGRRGTLVTAHLGKELGGTVLARMAYKITTVAGIRFTPLSPFIKAIKETYGMVLTSAERDTFRMLRTLVEVN